MAHLQTAEEMEGQMERENQLGLEAFQAKMPKERYSIEDYGIVLRGGGSVNGDLDLTWRINFV